MSSFAEEPGLPDGFSGQVRLFPLPNLVMFPHALQPLHIFEPRYRSLLEDALEHDQVLATALLQPGWEADYEGRPGIHPVLCLGRVVSHARLEDGRYNVLLLGLRRATVIRELPADQAYRRAEVAILEDVYPAAETRRARTSELLLRAFQRCFRQMQGSEEALEPLLKRDLPLGVLTDIVSFTMKFEIGFKQSLLGEWNVDTRARMLLARLARWEPPPGDPADDGIFPPRFSEN